MSPRGTDGTAVHDDDPVGILHGSDALRDDDLRRFRHILPQCLPDRRVGPGIDGAGGIVKYQYFGLFQQRPRDAQALFLPAGNVGPALFDMRVVTARQPRDKFVRAGHPAGGLYFLVGRFLASPEQVFFDGTGEKNILLQHDRNLITQRFKIVAPYVRSADLYDALSSVVKPRDQLDQRRFGGTGAADDADCLPRTDPQVNI